MLRTTLWVAAGCVVLLAVLALSRGLELGGKAEKTAPKRLEIEAVSKPAPAPAPQPEAPPPVTPEELQMQEDAAAVGMTTLEPEAEPAPEAPPVQ